jgi:hypothetical protein
MSVEQLTVYCIDNKRYMDAVKLRRCSPNGATPSREDPDGSCGGETKLRCRNPAHYSLARISLKSDIPF